MTTTPITQQEIDAVFPTVAETMADALGCDVEDIKPNVSLIEGLDAEDIARRAMLRARVGSTRPPRGVSWDIPCPRGGFRPDLERAMLSPRERRGRGQEHRDRPPGSPRARCPACARGGHSSSAHGLALRSGYC